LLLGIFGDWQNALNIAAELKSRNSPNV
jgi:hypothetical protein